MAFFDNLERVVSQAGSDMARKTRDFSETTRINSAINSSEKQVSLLYAQLGKQYFETEGKEPDDLYKDLCVAIQNELERIGNLKKQVQEIKGITTCENCGSEIPSTASFCNVCGNKIERKVPVGCTTCKVCGAVLDANTMFCYSCGNKVERDVENVATQVSESVLEKNVCSNCGNVLEAEQRFCNVCGSKVSD